MTLEQVRAKLVVVWSGAAWRDDRPIAPIPLPVPTKRQAAREPARPAAIEAWVLAELEDGPATVRQMAVGSPYSEQGVKNAAQRLVRQRKLEATRVQTPGHKGPAAWWYAKK